MPVVEELVAKIGFRVDGLDKLKGASKRFEGVRQDVQKTAGGFRQLGKELAINAVAMRAAAGGRGLGAYEDAAKGAAASTGGFLRTLGGLARTALIVKGGLVGLAGTAITTGRSMAKAAADAAKARRDFQIEAESLGTNAQNMDGFRNFFEKLGFDDASGKVKELVKDIRALSKGLQEGGEAGKEAEKTLEKLGLKRKDLVGPDGKPRDSSALAFELLERYAAADTKARDAEGKKAKNAADLEKAAARLAKGLGLSDTDRIRLRGQDLARTFDQAGRMMPVPSDADEAATRERAKRQQEIDFNSAAIAKGIGERAADLGKWFSDKIYQPAMLASSRYGVERAKSSGVIRETVGEREERLNREATARDDELTRRYRELDAIAGSGGDDAPGAAGSRALERARLKDRIRQLEDEKRGGPASPTAPLPPERPGSQPRTPPLPPARLGEGQSTGTNTAGLLERISAVLASISPQTNASKIASDAQVTREINNTDFGNDQRTINNSVTINQSVTEKGVAGAAASGVRSGLGGLLGPSTAKGMSATTGGPTSP